MDARYVFRVRFGLDVRADVSISPDQFETRLFRPAAPPGEPGWRFFRDNLWRGRLADEAHFRRLTGDALGVPVVSVIYRAFETDEEYLQALREEIGENLAAFRADTVTEVLSKYLGSSIELR